MLTQAPECLRDDTEARIDAVDALRGLAVLVFFASTSGARCVFSLPDSPVIAALRTQLRPSAWHGVTLADLCYPTFLFVAGASLALSFDRRANRGGTPAAFVKRSLWRACGLFAIGFLIDNVGFTSGRRLTWTGPLQQLAAGIMLGGIAAVLVRRCGARLALSVLLLGTYGGLLAWGPHAGVGAARYQFDENAAAVVDERLLPGTKFFGNWDPHGVLTTIPATALLLGGLAAGTILTPQRARAANPVVWWSVAGLICLNAATALNHWQPWNTHLGTPAFHLAAAGGMLFVLAGLAGGQQAAWFAAVTKPLRMLGRNSLLAVIVISVVPLSAISDAVMRGNVATFLGGLVPVARLVVELAVIGLPAHLLFRRRCFFTV